MLRPLDQALDAYLNEVGEIAPEQAPAKIAAE
jgi:hypothetical protein